MDAINIIVPVHNLEHNLQNLESWLDTVKPGTLEIIIVHDIGEDRTGEVIQELISKHPRLGIRLVEGHFGSPGMSRNAGLKEISNQGWISFWDGDDFPLVDNFLEMVHLAELEGKKISVGGFEIVDIDISRKFSREVHLFNNQGNFYKIALSPGIWRWAFKRQRINAREFKNFQMGEDQEYLAELNVELSEIYFYEKTVYKYFVSRPGQLTSSEKSVKQLVTTIKLILDSADGYKSLLGQIFFLRQLITLLAKGTLREKLKVIGYLGQFTRSAPHKSRIYRSLLFDLIQLAKFQHHRERTTQFFLFGGLGNQLFQYKAAVNKTRDRPVLLNASLLNQSQIQSADLLDFSTPANVYFVLPGQLSKSDRKILNVAIRYSASKHKVRNSTPGGVGLSTFLQLILRFKFGGSWFVNRGVGADVRFKNAEAENYLGYFQFSNLELGNTLNRFSLQLKKVSPEFEQIKSSLNADMTLVVQVRVGDYKKEDKIGLLGERYFETQIQEALKAFPIQRVYLHSDSPETASEVIPLKLRSITNVIHSDSLKSSELLELMRYGSYYIISNSTFGWWGAYLSYTPTPVVIVPEPWFSKLTNPTNLIPIDWHKASRYGL